MPSEGNHIFKLFFCHGKLSGVFKPASGAVHIKDQPVQGQRRIVVGASQQFFHDFLRVLFENSRRSVKMRFDVFAPERIFCFAHRGLLSDCVLRINVVAGARFTA